MVHWWCLNNIIIYIVHCIGTYPKHVCLVSYSRWGLGVIERASWVYLNTSNRRTPVDWPVMVNIIYIQRYLIRYTIPSRFQKIGSYLILLRISVEYTDIYILYLLLCITRINDRTRLALALVIEIVDLHTPAAVHTRRRVARDVYHLAVFSRVTWFANTPETRNTS